MLQITCHRRCFLMTLVISTASSLNIYKSNTSAIVSLHAVCCTEETFFKVNKKYQMLENSITID